MSQAVCRIKKLKDAGAISSSESHVNRKRSGPPNANLTIENRTLIDLCGAADLNTVIKNKVGNNKIRSNAVLAVEMLLSASPDYFYGDDKELSEEQSSETKKTLSKEESDRRINEFACTVTEWLRSQYQDNAVKAEMHLDEITPHIHAYIVPIDYRGKLNCTELFGDQTKLSELQDSFYRAVAHLGLSRGIKGSKATHTDIKRYYTNVNRDSLNLDLEVILPKVKIQEAASDYRERVIITLEPQLEIINDQLSDRAEAIKQKKDTLQKALASEKERQRVESDNQKLIAELNCLRTQLSDLPLEDVAYSLGLNPSQEGEDERLWIGGGHIIDINDSGFYSISKQLRGNSALDLVMIQRECQLREAIIWLNYHFSEAETLRCTIAHSKLKALEIISKSPAISFVPPREDETRWAEVRQYLTQKQLIPEILVNKLHSAKLVYAYADTELHAVFVHRRLVAASLHNDNTMTAITGATQVLITRDATPGCAEVAPGTMRRKGWFYIRRGKEESGTIELAVLTSSPLDAISRSVLQPPETRTLYLAVDDVRSIPESFLKACSRVIAAYNNDTAGEKLTLATLNLIPNTQIIKPNLHNWNEELKKRYGEQQKVLPDKPQDKPQFDILEISSRTSREMVLG